MTFTLLSGFGAGHASQWGMGRTWHRAVNERRFRLEVAGAAALLVFFEDSLTRHRNRFSRLVLGGPPRQSEEETALAGKARVAASATRADGAG